jgi:N-acetylmuramoyl-L-alanine amidase
MTPQIRRAARAVGLALAAAALAAALSSCQSTGGYYGPGAGFFDTVIVDAGHGGHDEGAHACSGAREKSLTLDTSRRLASVLRSNGMRVIENRTGDYFVTLGKRVAVSNATGQAVFVSVHYNWSGRRAPHGIEIYYNAPRSKRLAANILRESLRAYPTDNRGIKKGRYYVLRNNRRPAVLCELGFVSNPSDNRNIQNPAVRQRIAERVAAGILAEKAGRRP